MLSMNKIMFVFLLSLSLGSMVFSAQIDAPTDLLKNLIDSTTAITSEMLPCNTDRDCPETSYCFLSKNPVCVSCFDCASRNRQNRIRCARTSQDCGDCLPGYVSNTYAHLRRWCKEAGQANAQPRRMDDTGEFINAKWMTVFAILCFSVIGFASYFCWYTTKLRNSGRTLPSNTTNNEPSVTYSNAAYPPPTYHESVDFDDDVSCSFQLRIVEHSMVDQKAIPYFGNELSGVNNHNGNAQQSTENSGITNNVVLSPFTGLGSDETASTGATAVTSYPESNPHNIHDENTTPSSWTPGENYGADLHSENQIAQTNDTKMSLPTKRKCTDNPENYKKQKGG